MLSADFSAETLQARREWHDILKVKKGKNLQLRILYPARLSFRFDREIKSFTDKQKLREFSTTKPSLQQMVKELLQAENKRPQLETRNLQMGKLINKSKYTIKVRNHPQTSMISKRAIVRRGNYKCRILGMHLKIKRPATLQQSCIYMDCYIKTSR